MPKILQEEPVHGTSKRWGQKGLAGEPQAARELILLSLQLSTLVANKHSGGSLCST